MSPYIDRRRDIGWKLYGLLGIEKGDKPRMHAQHGRNYQFFDAPVGLFFTIDRVMQRGSLLDYGMYTAMSDTCLLSNAESFPLICEKGTNFLL